MILNKIFNYKHENVKRMILRLRGKFIILIFLSSFILIPIQISAEEECIISRIVDAEYPPSIDVHKDRGHTSFTFTLKHQTVNPTSSPIDIHYVCSPLPFPYLRANLQNKNLTVEHALFLQWPDDILTIPPNDHINKTCYIYFRIDNYFNESLPRGIYEMWFDYTNCSTSPVPVIIEKMYVDVTETSITYYFEFNNESRIVSSLEQTNNSLIFTSIFLILMSRLRKLKKYENE